MKLPASPSIAFPPAGTGRRVRPRPGLLAIASAMTPAPWMLAVRAVTPRAERAGKLLPARLQPMVSLLEDALGEVHRGELDPRAASAMASLAGALVRTITAGELEERLRALEDRGGGKVSP